MKFSRTLPAVALCATILAATHESRADTHGWYIGAALAEVSPDYAPRTTTGPGGTALAGSLDPIGSRGYKILAAYRAIDWLAFEADYLGLDGNSAPLNLVCVVAPCPERIRTESSGASLSALALWPLGRFDLFARAGLSRWESNLDVSSDGTRLYSRHIRGTDAKFGAGAQVHVRKITARLEYEHLRFGADAADTWSIGAAYSFR
ncbi:MAG TPA: outer membrane beta-barrel protein [Steroidobacteraceae bacterium]|nr:outer membrane beta-barrel protein [Steroidobacteraceae bacterium]